MFKQITLGFLALAGVTMARGAVKGSDDLYAYPDQKVLYSAWDDVAVVDFAESYIDYDQFAKLMTSEEMLIGDVRELLYKFTKKVLFVPGRTPKKGEAFHDKWNHLSDVVIQKAIKDMFIRDLI